MHLTGSNGYDPGHMDNLQLNPSDKTQPLPFGTRLTRLINRFNQGLHLFLLAAFMLAAILIAALFIVDIAKALTTRTLISGFLHALGSLLILWTVSELINAEIAVLRGRKFGISVFIDVALAATLRKILISGVNIEKVDMKLLSITLTTLLVLAIVRWLVSYPVGGSAPSLPSREES
ncbi:MAG: phosphate-starvation-inducible PsiE family protein [Leptospirales bacterium]